MIVSQLSQLERTTAKSLSLEFFLHEYVKALSIAARLENAMPEAILRDLEKLSFDPLNRPFQTPGILDRLCSYSETFLETSKAGELLYHAVDDLRILISKQRIQMSSKRNPDLSLFSLSKLQQELYALYPLLEEILQENSSASPVLYTLLELRQTLDLHLGVGCVERVLKRMFPQGPKSLSSFLTKSFSKRGFNSFIQNQESLFEGLSWSS